MQNSTITGTIRVHPRGFGFLQMTSPESMLGLSAFIIPPDLNPFLTDDEVSAELLTGNDGRHSATKLTLLARKRSVLYGEVTIRKGKFWLRTDRDVANTDWPLDAGDEKLEFGDLILAEIVSSALGEDASSADKKAPTARFTRRILPEEDKSLARLIARHDLRDGFPKEVIAQLEGLKEPHLVGNRRDLRKLPTVTIDAPSTRDIDDAVSVLPADEEGALRLFVSIADPSAFIPKGSPLDIEAQKRATSVYLAGKLLPMLPEEISAAHLSLVPNQDRSCMTVELRIDAEGEVVASDVYESVICSWARLNYEEVADFLDKGLFSEPMQPVKESMPWFRAAFARLTVARRRRGGVEVAREEARISFDPQTGAASDVKGYRPTAAHSMIERFMVAANEAIATWLQARGIPALYRVHEAPKAERVAELASFAHNFGVEAGFGKRLTPLSLAAFDSQITGIPSEPAMRSVLLRALGPARYTSLPAPHFGLAAPLYLHFTSPLRRFADFEVHRMIRRYLHGARDFRGELAVLESLGRHINERAYAASRAENDRFRMLAAGLMMSRIGQEFQARVTRMKPFGMLIQLDTTLIEGMVAFDGIPGGPYKLDERETTLTSQPKGETEQRRLFTIGTAVCVVLTAADPMSGKIDFVVSV
jgi:ribonuclease R